VSGSTRPPAKKRFGQHFLEPAWVVKVVKAIDPQPDQLFVEIGPGGGALTRPLLERSKSVVAFEIDRDLAGALRGSDPGLTLVEGDFLESAEQLRALGASGPVRVAGNLPYNVASPILFKLRELYAAGVPVLDATLMLQREVADRLIAAPGGHEYGVLSILIQYMADVERILALPPGAFRPAPKVRSALVRVRFRPPTQPAADRAVFEGLVQAVFTRRRKTLANALQAFALSDRVAPGRALAEAGLDGSRRPEVLSIGEFVRLADAYVSISTGAVL
jgi:16S rRNA (adenine1518-N6/adenine1519-N6)-dimethyltransferase